MKKTLNINLAGYPFTIDEDAYHLLKDYLDTIRYAFETNQDTEDLASDIESRIAEILLENEAGRVKIVSLDEISKVIERIGKPSDFIEVEENFSSQDGRNTEEVKVEQEQITPPPYNPQNHSRNPFVRKRLFRDPQNSLLGGVCSGLAYYLHIDVTIIRLIAVLLFFLSASTVAIVYIILWIVVPDAATPLQRMQMMGEDPTMENIGRTVTETHQDGGSSNNPANNETPKGFLATLFSIFTKCLIILGLVIAVPLLVAFALGLVGCVIAVIILAAIILGGVSPDVSFGSNSEEVLAVFILLAVIGGIITLGIPLWLLVRNVWKKKDTNPNPAGNRALLIVWLCGIALLSVFTVKAVKKGRQIDHNPNWGIYLEQLEGVDIDEEDVESVKVNPNGVIITDKTGKTVIINRSGVSVEMNETEQTDEVSEESPADSIPLLEIQSDSIQVTETETETIKSNLQESKNRQKQNK